MNKKRVFLTIGAALLAMVKTLPAFADLVSSIFSYGDPDVRPGLHATLSGDACYAGDVQESDMPY